MGEAIEMKVLVTYLSQTGNTKKVAEAIFGEIKGDKEMKTMEATSDLNGYDLAFVGFPVWSSGPAEPARKFLEAHAKGKKVALFVTHATPPIPQMQGFLNGILAKCKAVAAQAQLVGFFDCQGALSEPVANMCAKSDNPMIKQFAALRPSTLGHPDVEELEKARAFARDVMKKA
jgi:flavodoxin